MTPRQHAGDAVNLGLHYLASRQRPNGSFVSYTSLTLKQWQPQTSYQTTFVPSLILSSLSSTSSPVANKVRGKLASFLLSQASATDSFNYFVRGSRTAQQFNYPDDLDDTFCAWIGLLLSQPRALSGKTYANLLNILLATETTPGGPYKTWLTSAKQPAWQQVDLGVNANVAYLLQLSGIKTTKLQAYLAERINSGNYTSDYYPSPFAIWYYLARACPPESRKTLAAAIRSKTPANPLQTALALSALTSLGETIMLNQLEQSLLNSQRNNGSWPGASFCADPSIDGQKYYHGGSALTTALVIEALTARQKQTRGVAVLNRSALVKPVHTTVYKQVTKTAAAELGQLSCRQLALNRLNDLLSWKSAAEIILLPSHFSNSLRPRQQLPNTTLAELGLASLYGWLSFTAADDVIDEAQVSHQPLVGIFARLSLQSFTKVCPNHTGFIKHCQQVFDVMDQANAWEIAHCRTKVSRGIVHLSSLPNYGWGQKLAERSLGHSLGLIACLLLHGYPLNSPTVKQLKVGMRHYLIARQIQDDLHDWQDDLAQGQINIVVHHLVKALGVSGQQSLTQLVPRLQSELWHNQLSNICAMAEQNLLQAARAFAATDELASSSVLHGLVQKQFERLENTRQKHRQASEFMQTYSQDTAKLLTTP